MHYSEQFLKLDKNTPEIRAKLESLGYHCHPSSKELFNPEHPLYNKEYASKDLGCIYTYFGLYNHMIMGYEEYQSLIVDCGDNEDLFFALAALREDSDYEQWFTDATHKLWFKPTFVTEDNLRIGFSNYSSIWRFQAANFHKATYQELIEHFKNKKSEDDSSPKMKHIEYSLPGATKIIDDNFFDLV